MANETHLWKWFSIFIRLRDAMPFSGYCKCITCGRIAFWREMDCGHYVPRQHKAVKYNEVNNHAQCKKCNGFEGGRMDDYKAAIDKRYGEGMADRLKIAAKQPHKFGAFEIGIMAEDYKKRAIELAKQKHLNI